ncbi:MAG: endo-1,4-beta-xylanase [Prevotellaceae bacterium]|nr:endo-1,4-beta-xylanase [Prevotellaceae bacterium]MDO4991499.1 endo-1,4-beta-xylanase [Prevotellaceae bacterium]
MKKIILSAALLCSLGINAQNLQLRKLIPSENILIGATVNQWLVASDLGLTEHQINDPSYQLVGSRDQMKIEMGVVPSEFNCVTAENCMKSEVISPKKGIFDFVLADQFVQYAQKHNLTIIAHAPIWHSQCAKWLCHNEDGSLVSKDQLKENMRLYINTVYGHFRGKIKGYDVVNEAIEDDGSYRNSDFYKIMGEEFIDWAFQCAQEADPNTELYYNDYSMAEPGKRATVVKMIQRLKSKGIRIDAVGLQTHIGMDFPDFKEYEKSIKAFVEAGVDVQLTETDMSILPNPYTGADVSTRFDYTPEKDPYKDGITADQLKPWQKRFKELFAIINKYSKNVKRVTFWGITDASSWKNDFPIKGRTDYPLPFDREGKFKF